MKLSNEFKVGVFATFTLAILIVGINFLKGKDLFADTITLKAVYHNLEGLGVGNPVFYYGVQIGSVKGKTLGYSNDTTLEITVNMEVNPEVRIPQGSIARIISSDLLQSKAIEIFPNSRSKTIVNDGDMLVGETEESLTDQLGQMISPIKDNAEKLMKDLSITLTNIEDLLNDQAKKDIQASLSNFRVSSHKLSMLIDESDENIAAILNDFKGASSAIKSTSGKLDVTVDQVNALTDSLQNTPIKSTVQDVQIAVKNLTAILSKIESGDGSLSLMLNDPDLYNDLKAAAAGIDELTEDIKNHPKHYLAPLGRKNRDKIKNP